MTLIPRGVNVVALGTILASAAVASVSSPAPPETWRGLRVAPEARCTRYDSDDYRYSQRVEDDIIADLGGIYSPYTGEWFATQRETDIEHMVARSEAHDSGLCAASADTKRRFANDLLNLTLASPRVNRHQKSDKDAADWLPGGNRCWFAGRVVQVRQKYVLSIDRREANALEAVLSQCESVAMTPPGRRSSTARSAQPNSKPLSRTQSSRGSECGPFANCTALRRVHPRGVPRGHCAYASKMDRDRDGWACER